MYAFGKDRIFFNPWKIPGLNKSPISPTVAECKGREAKNERLFKASIIISLYPMRVSLPRGINAQRRPRRALFISVRSHMRVQLEDDFQ